MSPHSFIPLRYQRLEPAEQLRRAREHQERMAARRSVRDFSPEPVPAELIELAVRTATHAPSGANLQPWHFEIGRASCRERV